MMMHVHEALSILFWAVEESLEQGKEYNNISA